ncbi:MAG: pilus assembly FimT family protein [Candidatus Cryosericum sp.]
MNNANGRTRGRGFSLIELIIVVAVIIILAGMAVPAFGSALARSRIQSNAAQVFQDLRLVRDSAIAYQQDLYVYVCTSPASGRTVYYYELFQKDPLNKIHYTPADGPVSGQFVQKTALYGMGFGLPVQSGAAYSFTAATIGGKGYLVLAFCCGKGNYFRGEPVVVSDTSVPTYVAFSSSIGIPVVDTANSRTWYVTVSPAGRASSTPVSP